MTVEHFAPQRKAEVMADTWGHLAPQPRRTYPADVLVLTDCFGSTSVVDFAVGDLPSSPWLYDHLGDLLLETPAREPASLQRFTGRYRLLVSGECTWTGKWASETLPTVGGTR